MIITILLGIGMSCLGISSGISTGSSSSRGGNQNQTIIIQKDAAGLPIDEQKKSSAEARYAAKNFAVKNYSKINADNDNDGGAYLNSLVVLMGEMSIPEANALALVKQALRVANGNADIFGEQIEKYVE